MSCKQNDFKMQARAIIEYAKDPWNSIHHTVMLYIMMEISAE